MCEYAVHGHVEYGTEYFILNGPTVGMAGGSERWRDTGKTHL